ncbi:GNAT family N-acetyltransferase [Maricaulis sp.]|uniref:GNAT family N-acetyltransferase n=1 Tax=Maricaulis sp. TaxID=1486257 RepID=UPI00261C23D0|nr:GNAT family N-acetyltransferase [Maricaulis sp.]
MKLDLDIHRPAWDLALMDRPAAVQQDWCYGDALVALGAQVCRAGILDGDTLVGLAQFTTRRIGGVVHMAACTRGPVWLENVGPDAKAESYRALKRGLGLSWPRITVFTPDETAPAGAGRMSRVMTGYSTVLLDLTQSAEALRAGLDGKWRNRLKAAEKSGLKVQQAGTKPAQYRWLLETEEGQRTERGYRAAPAALVPAYAEAKGERSSLLILRADKGRSKTAAMLFLIHGRAATYHMGWADETGRRDGAHNLLLWSAIEALQARGIVQLDLGGVNTASGAGIARFKIGTGGRVVTLGGSYF